MKLSYLAIFGLSPIVAMPTLASPDRLGDYYSNEAPLKGKAPAPHQSGSLWQVVAVGLNCRRKAGENFPVVRRFSQGDILQAEVYRGGSDEVLINSTDRRGKPWMPVRDTATYNYNSVCYVRANRRYITPAISK